MWLVELNNTFTGTSLTNSDEGGGAYSGFTLGIPVIGSLQN